MRWLIRTFFRTLRRVLGPIMLLMEKLTTPRALPRTAEEQARLDAATRGLALYQFRTCPFCIKVRREIARLSLNIELRDAQWDAAHRQALLQGGGTVKVPCLRIPSTAGKEQWLYESSHINAWLNELVETTLDQDKDVDGDVVTQA